MRWTSNQVQSGIYTKYQDSGYAKAQTPYYGNCIPIHQKTLTEQFHRCTSHSNNEVTLRYREIETGQLSQAN